MTWADSVSLVVEIADSGNLITTPGTTTIALPPFSVGTSEMPTGWDKLTATGTPQYNRGTGGTGIPYVLVSRETGTAPESALGRHGWITTAYTAVAPGETYRYEIQGSLVVAPTNGYRFVRIDFYDAASPVSIGGKETTVVPTSAEFIMEVNSGPIPAGVSRIRVSMGVLFVAEPPSLNQFGYCWTPVLTKTMGADVVTFRDVSCDVQAVAIRYGREKMTDRFDVGTIAVTLINADGAYTYANPHPDGFGPGRQIRISADYEGLRYPMAYAVIDSIMDDLDLEGKNVAVVQAFDPTSLWASINWRSTYGTGVGSGELTGARITRLLDFIAYPKRMVDPGTIAVQALPAVSGRPLRDDAGITADTEGGAVYAERDGSVVFRDATWKTNATYANNVMANMTAQLDQMPHEASDGIPDDPNASWTCPHAVVTDWSLRRVINRVALANAGGVAQTFDRQPSQLAHGVRGYQRLDYIGTSDAYLPARATKLLDQYQWPVLRVNSLSFRPAVKGSHNEWRFTLQVFFNWLVRIWYTNPLELWGYSVAAYVQGIQHTITLNDWVTTLTVDEPRAFTELEWATEWGWDAGIWDEDIWDQTTDVIGAIWNDGKLWSNPTSKWGE